MPPLFALSHLPKHAKVRLFLAIVQYRVGNCGFGEKNPVCCGYCARESAFFFAIFGWVLGVSKMDCGRDWRRVLCYWLPMSIWFREIYPQRLVRFTTRLALSFWYRIRLVWLLCRYYPRIFSIVCWQIFLTVFFEFYGKKTTAKKYLTLRWLNVELNFASVLWYVIFVRVVGQWWWLSLKNIDEWS